MSKEYKWITDYLQEHFEGVVKKASTIDLSMVSNTLGSPEALETWVKAMKRMVDKELHAGHRAGELKELGKPIPPRKKKARAKPKA